MHKRIWNARWYFLLGLLIFLITLVVTTPLHFVWRMVAPQLSSLPVHVQQVSGTLWQGRAQFMVPQLAELGTLSARWAIDVWPLLRGQLTTQVNIEGNDLRLTLPLSIRGSQVSIHGANGYLNTQVLRPILQREGGQLSGEIELQQLVAKANLNPLEFTDLGGRVVYGGGAITILIDGNPINANLPLLIGQLGREPDRAAFILSTQENDTLLQGYLQPDGWAGLALRRRFVDLLGQTWPAKSEPDTVIFEVSRKVL